MRGDGRFVLIDSWTRSVGKGVSRRHVSRRVCLVTFSRGPIFGFKGLGADALESHLKMPLGPCQGRRLRRDRRDERIRCE